MWIGIKKNWIRPRKLDCITELADGIAYLNTHLKSGNLPAWIVPALPVHLAWEWCRMQLEQEVLIPLDISSKIDGLLPNPMRGPEGNIYVSHADFICPAHCNEPHDTCTVTQQPQKLEMYKLLSQLRFKDFSSLVIQSHQLGPGVGGYGPGALLSLIERIEVQKTPFLLSTACRCHAVITGFNRKGYPVSMCP